MPMGRQVILQLLAPGRPSRTITGLRVAFDVRRSGSSTPAEATVTVWNPAESTISQARAEGAQIRVLAGYETPQVIYQGEPARAGVQVEKQGPDRVMSLQLADGWRVLADTWVTLSWAVEVRAQTVVDALVQEMGLATGTVRVPGDLRWPRGLTLAGPASKVLDDLADSLGSSWQLVDGAVQFIGADQAIDNVVPKITGRNGMLVGSPTRRTDGLVEVRMLLSPAIKVGRRFLLESDQLQGTVLVTDLAHVGDSHGGPFYTEITGKLEQQT